MNKKKGADSEQNIVIRTTKIRKDKFILDAKNLTRKGTQSDFFWQMYDVYKELVNLSNLYYDGDVKELLIQMRLKIERDIKK